MQAQQRLDNSVQTEKAIAERSVTLLGATGSVGAGTIDLIKRERGRYRVEAVTANSNASKALRNDVLSMKSNPALTASIAWA